MDTDHVTERIPSYVLEILDPEERRIVNSHLSECVSCRRELAEYRAAMDLLAESLPLREPSDRLRSLVLQKVARAASHQPVNAVQRTPVQGFWDSLKSFLVQPAGLALVLLLLVLNIGLAINTIHLNRQLGAIQARLPSSDIRVILMAGTEQAPGSTGYMMIFTNETAGTLAVREAPILEPGYQYQVLVDKRWEAHQRGSILCERPGVWIAPDRSQSALAKLSGSRHYHRANRWQSGADRCKSAGRQPLSFCWLFDFRLWF